MCPIAGLPRKRARTAGDGEEEGEAVPVADGFEAPIFGARVVGQVTTLALEGRGTREQRLMLLLFAANGWAEQWGTHGGFFSLPAVRLREGNEGASCWPLCVSRDLERRPPSLALENEVKCTTRGCNK